MDVWEAGGRADGASVTAIKTAILTGTQSTEKRETWEEVDSKTQKKAWREADNGWNSTKNAAFTGYAEANFNLY